ncbi:hypothetical protein [Rhodanobacter sp. C05]|uniref:hypothetical protein n=1 Tax=Rhodanobacter sp. C05 TaxID=1945855 RepID=UPI000986A719|nr:hypothetical protein [Rhodanobacter sp. C05]OOG43668.1 hypothetical protein B0E51_02470 [Rhodanobacter sp. C05]
MPTTYESGHFYATPVLDNGKAMRMVLDTGGGFWPSYWINKVQADALSLSASDSCEVDGRRMRWLIPGSNRAKVYPVSQDLAKESSLSPQAMKRKQMASWYRSTFPKASGRMTIRAAR